ncbi:hypothetical protein TTRE_0000334901 [Trichuris trichiura]|uniref:CBFD NFYB HMF domain containing protein n=1 Tax=Trichuris trichiura TaxID=36087 RepID=A0A077Z603_TRITR|nr:hypothetical protein TTRE_0000334901 [Trichuris trichiura]
MAISTRKVKKIMKHGSCVDRISADAELFIKDLVKETIDHMPPGSNVLTLEHLENVMRDNPKYQNILSFRPEQAAETSASDDTTAQSTSQEMSPSIHEDEFCPWPLDSCRLL